MLRRAIAFAIGGAVTLVLLASAFFVWVHNMFTVGLTGGWVLVGMVGILVLIGGVYRLAIDRLARVSGNRG